MDLLIQSLIYFIEIYTWIIIAYVLISWFPDMRRSKFYELLASIVEPFLNIFRFATFSGISFAPILAFLTLQLIEFLLRGIM